MPRSVDRKPGQQQGGYRVRHIATDFSRCGSMQHRSGSKTVVADDAVARAKDQRPRCSIRFVSPGAAFQPFVQSRNAGFERI
jgi:hypothetical protein